MARNLTALGVSYGGYAVSILSTAVLIPCQIAALGDQGYGLWTLTFSFLSLLSLLEGGMATAWMRFVSSRPTPDSIQSGLTTALRLYLLVAGAGLLVLALLTPFWANWAGVEAQTSLPLLWILGARQFYAIVPLTLFKVLLFGLRYTIPAQAWGSCTQILYTLLAWSWLRHEGGILGLALLNLGVALIEHFGYLLMARRWLPGISLRPFHYRPELAQEFKVQALAGVVVQLASLILLKTDPLLVNALLPLQAVALYGVALKVAENYLMFLKQFLPILTPQLGAASQDPPRLRYLILRASCWSTVPAMALALPIWLGGERFLELWVGSHYQSAHFSLSILLLSSMLSLPQMVISSALAMSGRIAVNAKAALIAAVINPLASFFWAYFYGLPGIALGTLTATLIVDLLIVFRVGCQIFEISLLRWFRIFGLAHAPGLLLALPFWILLAPLMSANLALWCCWAGFGALLYAGGVVLGRRNWEVLT